MLFALRAELCGRGEYVGEVPQAPGQVQQTPSGVGGEMVSVRGDLTHSLQAGAENDNLRKEIGKGRSSTIRPLQPRH
jgi:hypothetical protein